MKKILFLILVFVSLSANAQYDKGVVTSIVKKYPENKPALFWWQLNKDHPQVKAMRKAIDKNKTAMIMAQNEIGDLSWVRPNAYEKSTKSEKTDSVINRLTGIKDAFPNVSFFVVEDQDTNAYMYPEGTCIINSGLMDAADNVQEIIGILAHEISHYILSHALNDIWRTAKAVKRNQTLAEIGTGLAMATYAGSQMYSAQYGVQQSDAAQQQMYSNLANAGLGIREEIGLRTNTITRLRYMRDTEEEADEVAFWFLEKNNCDPMNYINMLRKMDAAVPAELKKVKNKTKYSTHPDMPKRIEKLEKMYKMYHKNK